MKRLKNFQRLRSQRVNEPDDAPDLDSGLPQDGLGEVAGTQSGAKPPDWNPAPRPSSTNYATLQRDLLACSARLLLIVLLRNEVAERHREHALRMLVFDLEGAGKPIAHGEGRWPGNQATRLLQGVLTHRFHVDKLIAFRVNRQLAGSVAKVEEVARHLTPPQSAARTQLLGYRNVRQRNEPFQLTNEWVQGRRALLHLGVLQFRNAPAFSYNVDP